MTWLLFTLVSGVVVPVNHTLFKTHSECQVIASAMYTKNKPVVCFTNQAKFKQKVVKRNVAISK